MINNFLFLIVIRHKRFTNCLLYSEHKAGDHTWPFIRCRALFDTGKKCCPRIVVLFVGTIHELSVWCCGNKTGETRNIGNAGRKNNPKRSR